MTTTYTAHTHVSSDDVHHVSAQSMESLWWGQAVACASRRSWQLENEHRRMLGTTAEIYGQGAVQWDCFARRLDVTEIARVAYENAPRDEKAMWDAYSAGINHALWPASRKEKQFHARGVSPTPWQPWTPLSVFLSHNLFLTNFPTALFQQLLSDEKPELRSPLTEVSPTGDGSNAWAVLSDEGPVLAADPHRLLEHPGAYYPVTLHCSSTVAPLKASGLGFVGVPGLPHYGQTDHIAWVTTSSMIPGTQLFTPDVTTRTAEETIYVRDADPVVIAARRCDAGPVVVDNNHQQHGVIHPVHTTKRSGFDAHLALLHATTARDAAAHLDGWVDPINRVIIADHDTIVSRHAGHVSASGSQHVWDTTHHTSPVVHANEPCEQAAPFTDTFCPPHRAQRLARLLERTPSSDSAASWVARSKAWQADTQTLFGGGKLPVWWEDLAQALRTMVTGDVTAGPLLAALVDVDSWDGDACADSVPAATLATCRAELAGVIAADLRLELTPARHFDSLAPWCDPLPYVGAAMDQVRLHTDFQVRKAAKLLAKQSFSTAWGGLHQLEPYSYETEHLTPRPSGWPGIGGDANTVCATTAVPGITHGCVRGPVARVVFTPGAPEHSAWITPFTESTTRRSAQDASSNLSLWLRGDLRPIVPEAIPSAESTESASISQSSRGGRLAIATGSKGLTLDVFHPVRDMEWFYEWTQQPRADKWGMRGKSLGEVTDIYTYLDYLPTHTICVASVGGRPALVTHMYDPNAEELGDVFDVRHGDVGLHLITAPPSAGATRTVVSVYPDTLRLLVRAFSAKRILIEPDATNHAALALAKRMGFREVGDATMSNKQARIAVLDTDDL